MRRAARVDANHAEIVAALRKCGFQVLDLSRVGQGCPDLLVRRGGAMFFVEVKTLTGRIRASQDAFARDWPVVYVRTIEDVAGLKRKDSGEPTAEEAIAKLLAKRGLNAK